MGHGDAPELDSQRADYDQHYATGAMEMAPDQRKRAAVVLRAIETWPSNAGSAEVCT